MRDPSSSCSRVPGPRSRRGGVALLIVLWLMAILTLLMYAFLGDMQVEYSIAGSYADGKKAEQLAWSAIEAAAAGIERGTQTWHGLNDPWANDEQSFFEVPLGDGAYSVFRPLHDELQTVQWGLDDEASKINLNTASRAVLLKLPGMTEEIADAIIDWRDPDATQSASGAENAYYNSLTPSYNAKNAPFETLEELLLVKGVTPEILFGEDANLNGRLDPNENDGDESWPPDNRDGKLDAGLWAFCTIWSSDKNTDAAGATRVNLNTGQQQDFVAAGFTPAEVQGILGFRTAAGAIPSAAHLLGNPALGIPPILTPARFKEMVDHLTMVDGTAVPGLVNINTAPRQVLLCLPGITDEIALKLVEYRTPPGTDLSNIGWVLDVIDAAQLQQFANFITVRSCQFRIQAVGRIGTPYTGSGTAAMSSGDAVERPGPFRRMMAVFDTLATPRPRLVYWKDQSKLGMPYDPQDGPSTTPR